MTIQEIGLLLSLILTICGWGITSYYQRQILERQIWAEKEKLAQQFAHEKEIMELQHKQKIMELEQQFMLNAATDSARHLSERRLALYPKIVELVYRARNMAREIISTIHPARILFDELAAKAHELEENVYASRMDLERDSTFTLTHSYKNSVMTFSRLSRDLSYYLERQDSEQVDKALAEMKEIYSRIEQQYIPVVDSLSILSVTLPPNETTK